MPFRLETADKYRLFTELEKAHADRLFIASAERPRLGQQVPVVVTVSGVPLTIEAEVVGLREESRRFAAGVWFRISDAELEKCRRILGLTQTAERYREGRHARRVACAFTTTFRRPLSTDSGLLKDLSETGARLEAPFVLKAGDFIEIDVHFGRGRSLPLKAEVLREGTSGRRAGLRFLDVRPQVANVLRACVQALAKIRPRNRPCVLLADDEKPLLDFFQRSLSRYGYDVHRAKSGVEALTMIRELKPKLVMLDVLMPDVDAVDLCKAMRADVELLGIPVLFVSHLEELRLRTLADESGATDYMAKPAPLPELFNLVGAYLQA